MAKTNERIFKLLIMGMFQDYHELLIIVFYMYLGDPTVGKVHFMF